MLPIVVDHDFEFSQLNHTLVEKLTSECSSVLRMMQVITSIVILFALKLFKQRFLKLKATNTR